MVDLFSYAETPSSGVPSSADSMSDILASLDPEQEVAARAGDGAILVRAGAGTGKTRTLVARIVHLVRERKVDPWSIMAVTFTRKAAREIRERVALALGQAPAAAISVGTFHSLSARLLRRHAELVDLDPRFVVVPEEDARRLVEIAVENCGVVPKGLDAETHGKTVASLADTAFTKIQQWKSWGLTARSVEDVSRPKRAEDEELFARVYVSYQRELQVRNMADFGDLILHMVDIFTRFPNVCVEESERVRHLLIDEAQDSNPAQVRWARSMSLTYRNVFAVGDEDQSIFSFQGGYPGALLDIVGKNAKHFGLTLNRRCTDQILEPAVALVGWNRRTAPKRLSSGVSGEKVGFRVAGGEREEAAAIASAIKQEMDAGVHPSKIAILVRANWVVQPLEEALLKALIPYEVIGGVPLLKRREILVAAAYLRLTLNPYDELAFDRVYDAPLRGVGQAAYKVVYDYMKRMHVPFYKACQEVDSIDGMRISGAMREGLNQLGSVLRFLYESYEGSAGITTSHLLEYVLGDRGVGYRKFLLSRGKSERKRLENLRILERLAEEEPDLVSFLDNLALGYDEEEANPDAVRISTMHSSKGLEWDVVFCPALEMDVTPNKRALTEVRSGDPANPWAGPSGGGMEEERRLVHVAFTRARKKLQLSCALYRNGKSATPSPFLPESGIDPLLAAPNTDRRPVKRARPSKAAPRAGRKGFGSLGPYT